MRLAFRNASGAAKLSINLSEAGCSSFLNPNPSFINTCPIHHHISPRNAVVSNPSRCHTLSGAETHAPPFSALMDKQFEAFRQHLEESGSLRDRFRAVATQIEATNRNINSFLLLIHQSRPMPEVLEKVNSEIDVLKRLFNQLAEIARECPGQYYRYHGNWKSETQAVVSLLAFLHWLETGTLLGHAEAEQKLGLDKSEFRIDVEDYLIGICFMANDLPRYVVNRVTAGDYDCPRKVMKFLTDLHAAFRMLNLRNDFLRKKFDGMKYDQRKVEEVYYDVKIRGLAVDGDTMVEGTEGQQ
ncbi:hypothetical protein DCAR_0310524 [Daucus carota subsp. sativus]|uniref:Translin n=1 Tax=Daucus carota subsp. sativus TaxID=79200 RepID=A0AAF1ASZ2_DAUCS|nr:PREDICTED: translin [Daucus carota subsp. sativus]WOG91276.1 hypothetical protein DCAR_0310524 [Daucus carota subsp. sativus]